MIRLTSFKTPTRVRACVRAIPHDEFGAPKCEASAQLLTDSRKKERGIIPQVNTCAGRILINVKVSPPAFVLARRSLSFLAASPLDCFCLRGLSRRACLCHLRDGHGLTAHSVKDRISHTCKGLETDFCGRRRLPQAHPGGHRQAVQFSHAE